MPRPRRPAHRPPTRRQGLARSCPPHRQRPRSLPATSACPASSFCRTAADRAAFLDRERLVRRTELQTQAAQDGATIGVWFEDWNVSGQAESLRDRLQFETLRQAARRGEIQAVYARDLSRLFRDLVQQEMWLAEMEKWGVCICIPELDFDVDAPTRALIRHQIGNLNEYMARRKGAVLSAVLSARVAAGLWVGRHASQ